VEGRTPVTDKRGRETGMSTQLRDMKDLTTKLNRIEERSRRDPKTVFNNLGHIIDKDTLRRCFHGLDGSKAVGIDGVTKDEYEKRLEANLDDLLLRIRRGSYHPRPSRIREIPKADGSMRPLAIACFEDKIVQEAVRQIVEKIYEPIFLNCSHGFRPNKGCQTALVALNRHLMSTDCGAVLEIDLQKYFNTIPHEPLIKMLKTKISDERFLHLIIKLLKAPTLNESGVAERNELGSPQGSILSPIIANIYLHYVLDLWFKQLNNNRHGGRGTMVRYADDVVFTFYSFAEAESFRVHLESRLRQFGIAVHPGKTKSMISGQREAANLGKRGGRMPTFSFLGFLHVWGKSWNKKASTAFWRIKRRTCPVRFRKKLAQIAAYIKSHHHMKGLVFKMKEVVQGYLNYFAINDNSRRVLQFIYQVKRILFKWLNRRSQKRSLTWKEFAKVLRAAKFPVAPRFRNLFFSSKESGAKPGACR
jgi:RNA-directed DNA polymerase